MHVFPYLVLKNVPMSLISGLAATPDGRKFLDLELIDEGHEIGKYKIIRNELSVPLSELVDENQVTDPLGALLNAYGQAIGMKLVDLFGDFTEKSKVYQRSAPNISFKDVDLPEMMRTIIFLWAFDVRG